MTGAYGRLAAALADRFTIERELGRGGMATVYLARDLKHDRPVALKVLRPELAAILGVERFLREIRLTAQLQHPHILTLIDSGEADGFLYYVMPCVEGESLRERLEREGQLPLNEALRITRAVASALDFAHGRGVIHRDIKPENIMLHQGEPMVADFGIALAVSTAGRERLTETGLSLGTPAYMSPEQASAELKLDGRTDQYSLASVLYEMLAGVPPYTGPTAQAIIARRLTDPVPPLRTVRETVPVAVERAVMKALARVPADRFASVVAFAQALSEAAAVRPSLRSVAVLPFLNLSADPENEYFADGITEDVIAQLSKIRSLKVISRTSVMAFKRREHSLREIAQRLQVATLLEGSVRRAGSRVRIVAQLIDVESDEHLWAGWLDYSVGGTRHRESTGTTSKGEAQRLLRQRLVARETRRLVGPAPERVTFAELEQGLVTEYELRGRRSLDRAKGALAHLRAFFGAVRAIDITPERVDAYELARRQAGAAAGTVYYEKSILRRMLRLAVRKGLLATRPEFEMSAPRNARCGFFEADELQLVLAELPEDLRPPVRFAYLTGWRTRSEVLPLTWDRVDFQAGTVRLDTSKNDEGRVFPFDALPELAELLRAQRERTNALIAKTGQWIPWVFHRRGRPIRSLYGAWRAACRRAGLEGKIPHDCRRTAVRNLERAGVSRSVAMQLTGHKTEAIYRRYAIVVEQDLREGVAKLANGKQTANIPIVTDSPAVLS